MLCQKKEGREADSEGRKEGSQTGSEGRKEGRTDGRKGGTKGALHTKQDRASHLPDSPTFAILFLPLKEGDGGRKLWKEVREGGRPGKKGKKGMEW
jgi:hypothetical protein